jgi:ubiquitin C-terminal hydrolase
MNWYASWAELFCLENSLVMSFMLQFFAALHRHSAEQKEISTVFHQLIQQDCKNAQEQAKAIGSGWMDSTLEYYVIQPTMMQDLLSCIRTAFIRTSTTDAARFIGFPPESNAVDFMSTLITSITHSMHKPFCSNGQLWDQLLETLWKLLCACSAEQPPTLAALGPNVPLDKLRTGGYAQFSTPWGSLLRCFELALNILRKSPLGKTEDHRLNYGIPAEKRVGWGDVSAHITQLVIREMAADNFACACRVLLALAKQEMAGDYMDCNSMERPSIPVVRPARSGFHSALVSTDFLRKIICHYLPHLWEAGRLTEAPYDVTWSVNCISSTPPLPPTLSVSDCYFALDIILLLRVALSRLVAMQSDECNEVLLLPESDTTLLTACVEKGLSDSCWKPSVLQGEVPEALTPGIHRNTSSEQDPAYAHAEASSYLFGDNNGLGACECEGLTRFDTSVLFHVFSQHFTLFHAFTSMINDGSSWLLHTALDSTTLQAGDRLDRLDPNDRKHVFDLAGLVDASRDANPFLCQASVHGLDNSQNFRFRFTSDHKMPVWLWRLTSHYYVGRFSTPQPSYGCPQLIRTSWLRLHSIRADGLLDCVPSNELHLTPALQAPIAHVVLPHADTLPVLRGGLRNVAALRGLKELVALLLFADQSTAAEVTKLLTGLVSLGTPGFACSTEIYAAVNSLLLQISDVLSRAAAGKLLSRSADGHRSKRQRTDSASQPNYSVLSSLGALIAALRYQAHDVKYRLVRAPPGFIGFALTNEDARTLLVSHEMDASAMLVDVTVQSYIMPTVDSAEYDKLRYHNTKQGLTDWQVALRAAAQHMAIYSDASTRAEVRVRSNSCMHNLRHTLSQALATSNVGIYPGFDRIHNNVQAHWGRELLALDLLQPGSLVVEADFLAGVSTLLEPYQRALTASANSKLGGYVDQLPIQWAHINLYESQPLYFGPETVHIVEERNRLASSNAIAHPAPLDTWIIDCSSDWQVAALTSDTPDVDGILQFAVGEETQRDTTFVEGQVFVLLAACERANDALAYDLWSYLCHALPSSTTVRDLLQSAPASISWSDILSLRAPPTPSSTFLAPFYESYFCASYLLRCIVPSIVPESQFDNAAASYMQSFADCGGLKAAVNFISQHRAVVINGPVDTVEQLGLRVLCMSCLRILDCATALPGSAVFWKMAAEGGSLEIEGCLEWCIHQLISTEPTRAVKSTEAAVGSKRPRAESVADEEPLPWLTAFQKYCSARVLRDATTFISAFFMDIAPTLNIQLEQVLLPSHLEALILGKESIASSAVDLFDLFADAVSKHPVVAPNTMVLLIRLLSGMQQSVSSVMAQERLMDPQACVYLALATVPDTFNKSMEWLSILSKSACVSPELLTGILTPLAGLLHATAHLVVGATNMCENSEMSRTSKLCAIHVSPVPDGIFELLTDVLHTMTAVLQSSPPTFTSGGVSAEVGRVAESALNLLTEFYTPKLCKFDGPLIKSTLAEAWKLIHHLCKCYDHVAVVAMQRLARSVAHSPCVVPNPNILPTLWQPALSRVLPTELMPHFSRNLLMESWTYLFSKSCFRAPNEIEPALGFLRHADHSDGGAMSFEALVTAAGLVDSNLSAIHGRAQALFPPGDAEQQLAAIQRRPWVLISRLLELAAAHEEVVQTEEGGANFECRDLITLESTARLVDTAMRALRWYLYHEEDVVASFADSSDPSQQRFSLDAYRASLRFSVCLLAARLSAAYIFGDPIKISRLTDSSARQIMKDFNMEALVEKLLAADPARIIPRELFAIMALCTQGVKQGGRPVVPTNMADVSPFDIRDVHIKLCTTHCSGFMDLLRQSCVHPGPYVYNIHCHRAGEAAFVGLRNQGATCYINSLLQQLFMIPMFRYAILSYDIHAPEARAGYAMDPLAPAILNLGDKFQYLISEMHFTEGTVLNPQAFVDACAAPGLLPLEAPVTHQNDASEFFTYLADRLGKVFPVKGVENADVFTAVLGGQLQHQIIGRGECAHSTSRAENFSLASLDVRGHRTLAMSLRGFVQGEVLSGDNAYACDSCGHKVESLKRVCFNAAQLPQTLAFALKRFTINFETFEKEKIMDEFVFPDTLDMYPYTSDGLAGVPQPTNVSYTYKLVGVTVHAGSAFGGHYYSFIHPRLGDTDPRTGSGLREVGRLLARLNAEETKQQLTPDMLQLLLHLRQVYADFRAPEPSPHCNAADMGWVQFNDDTISSFSASEEDRRSFWYGGYIPGATRRLVPRPTSAYMLFYERTLIPSKAMSKQSPHRHIANRESLIIPCAYNPLERLAAKYESRLTLSNNEFFLKILADGLEILAVNHYDDEDKMDMLESALGLAVSHVFGVLPHTIPMHRGVLYDVCTNSSSLPDIWSLMDSMEMLLRPASSGDVQALPLGIELMIKLFCYPSYATQDLGFADNIITSIAETSAIFALHYLHADPSFDQCRVLLKRMVLHLVRCLTSVVPSNFDGIEMSGPDPLGAYAHLPPPLKASTRNAIYEMCDDFTVTARGIWCLDRLFRVMVPFIAVAACSPSRVVCHELQNDPLGSLLGTLFECADMHPVCSLLLARNMAAEWSIHVLRAATIVDDRKMPASALLMLNDELWQLEDLTKSPPAKSLRKHTQVYSDSSPALQLLATACAKFIQVYNVPDGSAPAPEIESLASWTLIDGKLCPRIASTTSWQHVAWPGLPWRPTLSPACVAMVTAERGLLLTFLDPSENFKDWMPEATFALLQQCCFGNVINTHSVCSSIGNLGVVNGALPGHLVGARVALSKWVNWLVTDTALNEDGLLHVRITALTYFISATDMYPTTYKYYTNGYTIAPSKISNVPSKLVEAIAESSFVAMLPSTKISAAQAGVGEVEHDRPADLVLPDRKHCTAELFRSGLVSNMLDIAAGLCQLSGMTSLMAPQAQARMVLPASREVFSNGKSNRTCNSAYDLLAAMTSLLHTLSTSLPEQRRDECLDYLFDMPTGLSVFKNVGQVLQFIWDRFGDLLLAFIPTIRTEWHVVYDPLVAFFSENFQASVFNRAYTPKPWCPAEYAPVVPATAADILEMEASEPENTQTVAATPSDVAQSFVLTPLVNAMVQQRPCNMTVSELLDDYIAGRLEPQLTIPGILQLAEAAEIPWPVMLVMISSFDVNVADVSPALTTRDVALSAALARLRETADAIVDATPGSTVDSETVQVLDAQAVSMMGEDQLLRTLLLSAEDGACRYEPFALAMNRAGYRYTEPRDILHYLPDDPMPGAALRYGSLLAWHGWMLFMGLFRTPSSPQPSTINSQLEEASYDVMDAFAPDTS